MKKILFFLFWAVVLCLSCNSVPQHTQMIPKNAQQVLAINVPSLAGPALSSFFEIKAWMGQNNTNDETAKDWIKSGLQLNSTLYFYTRDNVAIGVFPVKAETWIKGFMESRFPRMKPVAGHQVYNLNDSIFATWNQHTFWLALRSPLLVADSFSSTSEIIEGLIQATKVEPENSIAHSPNFKSFLRRSWNIGLWVSPNAGSKSSSATMMDNNFAGKILSSKDAFSLGINFKQGKLSGEALVYLSEKNRKNMAPLFEKNCKTPPPVEWRQNLPVQQSGWSVSPTEITKMLKSQNIYSVVAIGLQFAGLSYSDFELAFKGNMTQYSFQESKNSGKEQLVVLPINNQLAVKNILKVLVKNANSHDVQPIIFGDLINAIDSNQWYLKNEGHSLYLSTSATLINEFEYQNLRQSDRKIYALEGPFYFKTKIEPKQDERLLLEFSNVFKFLKLDNCVVNSKGLSCRVELEAKNADESSLVQVLNHIKIEE